MMFLFSLMIGYCIAVGTTNLADAANISTTPVIDRTNMQTILSIFPPGKEGTTKIFNPYVVVLDPDQITNPRLILHPEMLDYPAAKFRAQDGEYRIGTGTKSPCIGVDSKMFLVVLRPENRDKGHGGCLSGKKSDRDRDSWTKILGLNKCWNPNTRIYLRNSIPPGTETILRETDSEIKDIPVAMGSQSDGNADIDKVGERVSERVIESGSNSGTKPRVPLLLCPVKAGRDGQEYLYNIQLQVECTDKRFPVGLLLGVSNLEDYEKGIEELRGDNRLLQSAQSQNNQRPSWYRQISDYRSRPPRELDDGRFVRDFDDQWIPTRKSWKRPRSSRTKSLVALDKYQTSEANPNSESRSDLGTHRDAGSDTIPLEQIELDP